MTGQTQTTTSDIIRYWDYKVTASAIITFSLSSNESNQTISSSDIESYIEELVGNQTDLLQETDYNIYVDVDISPTNGIDINTTIWTEDEAFFIKLKEYLISNEFETDLSGLLYLILCCVYSGICQCIHRANGNKLC